MDTGHLLIGAAVLVAAVLRGLTGFGFAVVAVPLIALTTDPIQTVTLTVLLQVMMGAADLWKIGPDIDRRELTRMGIGAAIGLPIGMAGLLVMNPGAARLAIATVALLGLLMTLKRPTRRYHPNPIVSAIVGLVSGVFAGLAAMPGPPAVAYFLASGIPARQARASLMVFFLITAVLTVPGLIWAGAVRADSLIAAVLCWPLLWIGSHLGRMMFQRMGEQHYRAAAIALMATATCLSGWRGLMALL